MIGQAQQVIGRDMIQPADPHKHLIGGRALFLFPTAYGI